MMLEEYVILFFLSFSSTNAIQACSYSPGLSNGNMHQINATQTRFWCKEGYYLRGNPFSSCVNGEWNTTGRSCEKFVDVPEKWVRCGYPGFPSNGGRYIDNYESVLRYHCNKGFILVGSAERNCKSNAFWSQPIPKCVKNLAFNKSVKSLDKNISSYDVSHNNETYVYVDLEADAQFDAVKIDFINDDTLGTRVYVTNQTDLARLKEIHSILNQNPQSIHFFISPEVAKYLVVKSLKKVSIKEITVYNFEEPTECGRPDIPFNGKLLKSEPNEAVYECNHGCTMIGTGSTRCVNGVWESELPVCLDISPLIPDNYCTHLKLISISVGVVGAFVILCLSLCLAYKYRVHRDKDGLRSSKSYTNSITCYKKPKKESDESGSSNQLYENINNISSSGSMNSLTTSDIGEYVYANDY